MSTELIAIISVGVAIIGVVLTLANLLHTVLRGMQKEMQSQRGEIQTLRTDMQDGFKDMRAKIETLRTETQEEFKDVRAEMHDGFKEVRAKIETLRTETQDEFKDVRTEMQEEFKTQRETTTNLLGRMAHVEGLLEGLREAFAGWRLDAVAEDPEEYDPRGGGAESKLTGSE